MRTALAILSILCGCMVSRARAGYAIRDGDTVVFLGDSITAARTYGKLIEVYTLLRFPERKVRFINAGHGGETAHGALARLDSDVFARGATVLTVAYGVNDIGWGMRADDAHKKEYLDAIAELIERCKKHNVRAYVCSAAITAEAPEKAEQGFLQKMCDEGLALATSKGAGAIDVQRAMRKVQRRAIDANKNQPDKSKQVKLHVDDGVHLNDLGQTAMAFAILKGLGAPADVSSATVDAAKRAVTDAAGCRVDKIRSVEGGGIAFTRLDERLPLNLAPLWMLNGLYIPIADELNRYMLSVRSFSPGSFEVLAGNRLLGTWTEAELSRGVNIASATADPWTPGGPWDAQGHAVKVLTDMRDEIVFARRGMAENLKAHPRLTELESEADAIERQICEFQRKLVQPVPVEFVVRPARSSK